MKKIFIILAIIFCQFGYIANAEDAQNITISNNIPTQNTISAATSNSINIATSSGNEIAENEKSQNPYMSNELRNSIAQNTYEPSFMGAVLSLIAVLGLIYLTGFLYQKLVKFNSKLTSKDEKEEKTNEFKMISCSPLGQNKFLHVVKINNKFLVLGSTPNSINLLREFSKDEINEAE